MITVADFRTRFPEFADATTYPDARIQMFIDDAVIWMDTEDRWYDWYELAQMYLTAHLLVVALATESGDTNALFPVSQQEVDDVIVRFAVADVSPKDDDFNSTSYGKMYYRYLRMTFTGIYGV